MAEINLNDLPLEPVGAVQVDFDQYPDPQEFAPPIPEGTYTFKTTDVKLEKFDQATGVVSFVMNHEAYDAQGTKVGTINFDRISTKVFNRQNIPVSMAADMLRAIGDTSRPQSPRQWGEAITAIKAACDQGTVWQGVVKWDGYCGHKDTPHEPLKANDGKILPVQQAPHALPTVLRGEKAFKAAVNGSGGDHTSIKCGVCGNDIQARAKIDRRIPKS